jgi:hypothetical protein
LESACVGNGTGGSNPPLSANHPGRRSTRAVSRWPPRPLLHSSVQGLMMGEDHSEPGDGFGPMR